MTAEPVEAERSEVKLQRPPSSSAAYIALKAQRAQWLVDNGPCQGCGSWDYLEIDHIDPATKTCPPFGIRTSVEDRRRELPKCQVLCSGCHRAKTIADMGGPPFDGRSKLRRYSVAWNAQKRAEQRRLGLLFPHANGCA